MADMAIRVLLIDDDVRLHELLASYLDQNGLTVTVAADGRKGLAALEGGTFDAVLLDLMMPGLDGIEVCKRIRGKSNIPIVMLTAKGDETDRVVGLELGADDYVAKPFSPRELLARLRAVLRRARPDVAGERLSARESSSRSAGESHTRSKRPPRKACVRCASRRHPTAPSPVVFTTIPTTMLVSRMVRPNHTKSRRWRRART